MLLSVVELFMVGTFAPFPTFNVFTPVIFKAGQVAPSFTVTVSHSAMKLVPAAYLIFPENTISFALTSILLLKRPYEAIGVPSATMSPLLILTSHGTTEGSSKTSRTVSEIIVGGVTTLIPPDFKTLITHVPYSLVKELSLVLVALCATTVSSLDALSMCCDDSKGDFTASSPRPETAILPENDAPSDERTSSMTAPFSVSTRSIESADPPSISFKPSEIEPAKSASSAPESVSSATAGTTGTREDAKIKEIAAEDDLRKTFLLEVSILNTSPERKKNLA